MAGDSDSNSKAPDNSPMPEKESPLAPEGEIESKSPPSPPPSSDSEEPKSPPPSSPPLPPSTPSTEQSTSTQESPTSGQASPWPPGLVPAMTTSPAEGQASPRPPGFVPAMTTSPADGQASPRPPGLVPTMTTTTPAFGPPTTNNHLTAPTVVASGGRRGGEAQTTSSSKSSPFSGLLPIGIIAGVAVGIVLLILVAILVVCLTKRKKKKHVFAMTAPPPPYGWDGRTTTQDQYNWQTPPEAHSVNISTYPTPPMASGTGHEYSGLHSGPNTSGLGLGHNKSTFRYEELATATNGFNQANMLGQGGFGYVHKGVLPDGRNVAVKSLKSGSGQGEREFMAEVEMLSRVHHRHLVSLVGYCIANGQRMLVYDFLPNDTLEFHLHTKGDSIIGFPTRLRIALGSAKGLAYLHEDCHPRIIHRDIKASNILLDGNFEAMVADFGLAKLTNDTNTHVSTRVMGTFGYLAPEYAASGKLTEKSDVFSFGVMLLELITGRRPVDPNMQYMEDSLVDWSRPLMTKALETGNFNELVDPKLEGSYNPQEMKRMVACAAASIRHSAKKRPKMSQIVRVLQGDVSLEDLNEGTKPGQSSAYSSSMEGSDYDTRAYSADLKRFRQIAFETQGFESNECGGGGSTSEDGLEPSSSSSSETSKEIKR